MIDQTIKQSEKIVRYFMIFSYCIFLAILLPVFKNDAEFAFKIITAVWLMVYNCFVVACFILKGMQLLYQRLNLITNNRLHDYLWN